MSKTVLILHAPEGEDDSRRMKVMLQNNGISATILADYQSGRLENLSYPNFVNNDFLHPSVNNFTHTREGKTVSFIEFLILAIDSFDQVISIVSSDLFDNSNFVYAIGYASGKDKIISACRSSASQPVWYSQAFRNQSYDIKTLIAQLTS